MTGELNPLLQHFLSKFLRKVGQQVLNMATPSSQTPKKRRAEEPRPRMPLTSREEPPFMQDVNSTAEPSAKRRKISSSPTSSPPCSPFSIDNPEPGSIYSILREHCGKMLYVAPAFWTDLHATLLQTTWREECSPAVSTVTSTAIERPCSTVNSLCNDLLCVAEVHKFPPRYRMQAVADILKVLFPDKMGPAIEDYQLPMRIGNRTFQKAIRVSMMWTEPPKTQRLFQVDYLTRQPMMAYVCAEWLSTFRKDMFCYPATNQVVRRINRRRAKMLTPGDRLKDPHILAIFIAMAQNAIYRGHGGGNYNDTPRFRDVELTLLTTDDHRSEFLCYKAVVTEKLLRKLHYPARAASSYGLPINDGVIISYTRVAMFPVLGIRERLGKTLGAKLVGEIKDDEWGSWITGIAQEDEGEATEPNTDVDDDD